MKGLPDSAIVYAAVKAGRGAKKAGRKGDWLANLGWDTMDRFLKELEAKEAQAKTEETK